MVDVRLHVLGHFEARLASGAPVTIPTRKAEAVLAYLALSPGWTQTRITLASLLWSRLDYPNARHNLRQTLLLLRKTFRICPEPLLIGRHTISLNPTSIEVDAAELSRLATNQDPASWKKAAVCYRGDLLEGSNIKESTFEDWLCGQRACLREQFFDILTKLLKHYITERRWAAATQIALRIVSLDPFREDIHRTLIEIYLKQNRTADAIQQYRSCTRILKDELGVDPECETNRLYRIILLKRNGKYEK